MIDKRLASERMVPGEGDEPENMVGQSTERWLAEEALRESEQRHRILAALTSDYTYCCRLERDSQFVIESASEGFQTVTGYTVEELEERGGWPVLIHPDDLPATELLTADLINGKSCTAELRIVTRQGEVRWIRFSACPEPGPGGGTARLLGAVQDITERKRAEEALRESEERLRRFFAAAFEGLAIHDQGVILDVNQALADLHGYTISELIGMHVLDLVAPASRELVRANILAGYEQPYEGLILRKDGSSVPAEIRGKPTRFAGRTVRVTALRDLSERKRAERQLSALSARLLEVQEEERRHLALELHDQVGQVLTNLQLTLKAAAELPPEEQASRLAEAQRTVANLTAQVRDLSQTLRPTALDDLGLLPALLRHVECYTTQTGIQVHLDHRGLIGRFRSAVETVAYRIIQEALTNVARHARTDEVTVRASPEAGSLIIEVVDHGIGFDAQKDEEIRNGSGLSGMQERAALLRGCLLVRSREGKGTHVWATLPLEDPAQNYCNGSQGEDVEGIAGG
jgi:PAS domain S-box-containing protein